MADSLRKRVRWAAAAAFGGIALLLGLLQTIFFVVVDGERWVAHTHEVRLTAERLDTALAHAEAAQRSRLLTGDLRALARFQLADEEVQASIAGLRKLVNDNPLQTERVLALEPMVIQHLALLRAPLGLAGEAAAEPSADVISSKAAIRSRLTELQEEERELLVQREGRVQVLRVLFVAGGALMALLLAGMLWRVFSGAITEVAREERLRAELERTLDEKLRLLKEVNHRVGNSLAMVGALLLVQTRTARDTRVQTALEAARARVTTVGQVHQRIMNAGTVDTLDMGEHLPAFCQELGTALGMPGQVVARADQGLVVTVDTGVALSLVINELAGSALRARDEGQATGPVNVALVRMGNSLSLSLHDPAGHLPGAGAGEADNDDAVSDMVVGALLGQLGARPQAPDAKAPGQDLRFSLDDAA